MYLFDILQHRILPSTHPDHISHQNLKKDMLCIEEMKVYLFIY